MMTSRPLILTIGFFMVAWWLLAHPYFDKPSRHRLTSHDLSLSLDLPPLDFSAQRDHRGYYASHAARDFCDGHDYRTFWPHAASGQRKVYDLFMANGELDMLEIRLATLYELVDYFIVVESDKTFSGEVKPFYVRDAWNRFSKYHDKMIYHELELPSAESGYAPRNAQEFENLQRDSGYDQVFGRLRDAQVPVQGDVIMVSDVDEIPRPAALLLLRTCAFPKRVTLASKFYWYSFQFLHADGEWLHPQATYYDGAGTIRPSNLRNGVGGAPGLRELQKGVIPNAAWHCSGCFDTMHGFLHWMASSSLAWKNDEAVRSQEKIANAVREGRDLWGREHDRLVRIEGNQDIPPILRVERDRFRYLLDREGESAGFKDFP